MQRRSKLRGMTHDRWSETGEILQFKEARQRAWTEPLDSANSLSVFHQSGWPA
jgi:hypothetical protein